MKALTVRQPWASLIAAGYKPYEFRGANSVRQYRHAIGQRIAIQAGARKVRPKEVKDLIEALTNPKNLPCLLPEAALFLETMPIKSYPLGAILCTARLHTPITGIEAAERMGCHLNDSDREGTFNWGWPLTEIEPVPNIPCRGWQGLWNVPEGLLT